MKIETPFPPFSEDRDFLPVLSFLQEPFDGEESVILPLTVRDSWNDTSTRSRLNLVCRRRPPGPSWVVRVGGSSLGLPDKTTKGLWKYLRV